MEKFTFRVVRNCHQETDPRQNNDVDFLIEEDGWNNYGYYVTYHIHTTTRLSGTVHQYLGAIEIMQVGQQQGQNNRVRAAFGTNAFNQLPDDYVSVCFAPEFYKWLQRRETEERQMIIEQLHIILDRKSPYYQLVSDDDCFKRGVLRDTDMNNYIFQKSRSWIYSDECRYDLRKESFEIQYDNCEMPVKLSFSCVAENDSVNIPNGIVAFIGSNGSGKSTALYKLASLMYLFPNDRTKLEKSCGKLIPNNLGVERTICISYSPFDNFTLPTTENHAIRYADEKASDADMRFIYCGIRNVSDEYKVCQESGIQYDINHLSSIRQDHTEPKKQELLAADFACAFEQFAGGFGIDDRMEIWAGIIRDSKALFPDLADHMINIRAGRDREERAAYFKNLSTGYKFFMHSFAYVISYITEGSLVLFDEPENHIHPPLLSFMMAQYRKILQKYKSVMLVSTHSPVIVQELFAKNVLKVYREGERIRIDKPAIETYGASFSEINEEVFGVTADVSHYFSAFDSLYDDWKMSECDSSIEMINHFEDKLGGGLSSQMVSYLIDKYFEDNPEKE